MEIENLSGNIQEVAGPDNLSENIQEVAETDKVTQKTEENSKYAAARREAESKLNVEKEKWNALAKSRGYNSADELEKALKQETVNQNREKLEEIFGINGEDAEKVLNGVIANNPLVKQAQSIINEREMENSKQAFENEVELIKKIDPSIKSFDDVINSESFAEVDRIYRAGGKSLSEAFKLANFDRLMSANEGKLRQQVINQMSGKDHLKGNGSGGSEVSTVTIPEETLKIYKKMMPGKSDAEYQKHYEKYKKE